MSFPNPFDFTGKTVIDAARWINGPTINVDTGFNLTWHEVYRGQDQDRTR